MSFLIWLITALHLLSIVTWVGGMAYTLLILRPSLAAIEPGAALVLQGTAFRRFFRVVWHVMPITIVTGILLRLLTYHGGPAPWPVTLMQIGGVLMGVIFVINMRAPHRRLQARLANGTASFADVRPVRALMLTNVVIGAVILMSVAAL